MREILKKLIEVLRSNEFVLVVALFTLFYLVVGPTGEFPINDDWLFVRQLEAFSKGIYKINVLIEPSFIAQGLLGLAWGKVFGVSFYSMRILTFFVSVFFFYGVWSLLKSLNVAKNLRFVALLLLAFNPVIFSSSLTFMTEIYFLTFIVWGFFFYLRFLKTMEESEVSLSDLMLGTLFCGLAFLVRQIALVIFISFVAALVVNFLKAYFQKTQVSNTKFSNTRLKPFLTALFYSVLIFSVVASVWFIWPRHIDPVNPPGVFAHIIEMKALLNRIKSLPFIFPSLALYLSPTLLGFKFKKNKSITLVVLLVGLLIFSWVYKHDVLPIGSVHYLEGLHAKSGFRTNLSVFDNIPFKVFVASIVAVSIPLLFYYLGIALKSSAKNVSSVQKIFLALNLVGFFLILILAKDFYDRYTLPLLITVLVLIVSTVKASHIQLKSLTKITLILLMLQSVFLSYEYMKVQRLKWNQAIALQEVTGLKTNIFLDGVYSRYFGAKGKNDYTGLIETGGGKEYKCYVQQYTIDGDGMVFNIVDSTNQILGRFFDNPRVYERKKLNVRRIKNHLDELIFDTEYFSPVYSIIGKRAFVGSWCNPGVVSDLESQN
jgi:hypothetical protein